MSHIVSLVLRYVTQGYSSYDEWCVGEKLVHIISEDPETSGVYDLHIFNIYLETAPSG